MTAVFVVEDEPLAALAHAAQVDRIPGFHCVGTAGSVAEAIAGLTGPEAPEVDAVLLDLHLPDGSGLEVCARLRRAGVRAAVVAVTADRDLRAVRGALGAGVTDYLIKPFSSAVLEAKLQHAASLAAPETRVSQHQVDHAFETLRAAEPLQKGLHADTLALVRRTLAAGGALSAGEVAERAAVSRPTARRYLEHLVQQGAAQRTPRYGRPGRPEHEYRFLPA